MDKKIRFEASIIGSPPYTAEYVCNARMQHAAWPHYAISKFIALVSSTPIEFYRQKITFTLFTHDGTKVYRMAVWLHEESTLELKDFWVPIVTKYILEK